MKVLVVVDMQEDFINGPLGNNECKAVVFPVVKLIENGEYDRIIATRDTHQENYLETQEGKKLPVVHCIEGSDGWMYESNVRNALNNTEIWDKVVNLNKPTFGSVELLDMLKNIDNTPNTQIDFCGVCTGICVISNAMIAKAAVPEANIRVIANACACVTPESHKTALEAMKLCQIDII